MIESEINEKRTISVFRFVGYGLLLLGLFDYINIFVPLQWLNPAWEFQTLGSLVERVPVPLLGLVLVFYRENLLRGKLEKRFLRILSWSSLLVGLLFILLVPLGVRDTIRINSTNEVVLKNQTTQQLSQTQQIEEQLNKAASPEDISNFLKLLNNQRSFPKIQDPQQVKSDILSKIEIYQKRVQEQSNFTLKNQKLGLLKKSIKWNLGALVSGVLFIYLWRMTSWARRRKI